MSINTGLFTSSTDNWSTPKKLFDELNKEFNFTTDVCASLENAKCKNFFNKEKDGLKQAWTGVCFMNTPYGRQIGEWVKKAYTSAKEGATVVCLLPSRTDTKWFQDYCLQATDIRFIKGRLKFGESKNSAPFPSVIVVFTKTGLQ